MPDKTLLIIQPCAKNFDNSLTLKLVVMWFPGLQRLRSWEAGFTSQRRQGDDTRLHVVKWEASKLVTQSLHRPTNQVAFSLKSAGWEGLLLVAGFPCCKPFDGCIYGISMHIWYEDFETTVWKNICIRLVRLFMTSDYGPKGRLCNPRWSPSSQSYPQCWKI